MFKKYAVITAFILYSTNVYASAVSSNNACLSNVINQKLDVTASLACLAKEIQREQMPKGAVVSFARECTNYDGWSAYYPAAGRMIVGAGPHHEMDENFRNEDVKGQPLSTFDGPSELPNEVLQSATASNRNGKVRIGGEESVSLGKIHIPHHEHVLNYLTIFAKDLRLEDAGAGTNLPYFSRSRDKKLELNRNGTGSIVGNNSGSAAKHNNMPPFIALYYCVKD